MTSIGALGRGLIDVLRAPLMLIGAALVMVVITAPFAAVLNSRLQESLSVQPQVSLDETEIDPEWWMEFREHARGLEATFTPAVLGFAATLDGLSGVIDGRGLPVAVLLPLMLSIVAWALLWGGILERFHARRGIGVGRFVSAGIKRLPAFITIAVASAGLNLLLYVTVHRVLFGSIYGRLVGLTTTERDAFFVRVALYAVFFSLVAIVSVIADYARVSGVVRSLTAPMDMIRAGIEFVFSRVASVAVLYLMTGAIFIAITASYGVLEIYGGSQVGGWRAVAIGQAYVLVRLAIRFWFAASELRLFTTNQTAAAE